MITTPINKTVMVKFIGYYDGNTVTALWNYAQNFGSSKPGALNLVAGANDPVMNPSGNLENIKKQLYY